MERSGKRSSDSNESDEKRLVERFLRGSDEASFLSIYRSFTPRLYGLAVHLLNGSHAEAEEAIQDLWIRAARKLSEFRWESELHTWLTGILIRCCSERRRRGAPKTEDLSYEPPAPDRTKDPALRLQLQHAISTLTAAQREVFLLHDLEGYTHEEIATMLGIEPGTSKSQLHHARRVLRSCLSAGRRES